MIERVLVAASAAAVLTLTIPAAAQTPTTVPVPAAARTRISDNVSSPPRDRVFYTYNYFQQSLNPAPFTQPDIQRQTIGFERTFLDREAMVRDFYVAFLGGPSFAGSSSARDANCDASNALFGCDGGIAIDGATGGGFRVEVGTHVARGIRIYLAGQGNYLGLRAVEFDSRGPTTTSFRANAAAHTITAGLALDSAALFPTLLPPRWNLYVQGGIGVSFNTLSGINGNGTGFGLTVPSATATNFAGEVGGGVEYALAPGFIATLGYNSLWLGDWRTGAGTGTVSFGAVGAPFPVGSIEGGPSRLDQVRLGFRVLLNRTLAPPPPP